MWGCHSHLVDNHEKTVESMNSCLFIPLQRLRITLPVHERLTAAYIAVAPMLEYKQGQAPFLSHSGELDNFNADCWILQGRGFLRRLV